MSKIKNSMRFIFLSLMAALSLGSCNTGSEKTTTTTSTDSISTDTISRHGYAPATDTQSALLTCTQAGPLRLSSTYSELEQQFGKENLSLDSIMPEGELSAYSTVIYKGTPRELIVIWEEKSQPFLSMLSVMIEQPNSVYHFSNGLKIGSTLREMQKLNGDKPLRFFGFSWDYGCMMPSPQEGNLARDIPCFQGRLNIEDGNYDQWMGDREFNSGMKNVPLDAIKLSSITLEVPPRK